MFVLGIAGLNIEIINKYNYVKDMCRDYIVDDNNNIDFSVEVSEADIVKEQSTARIACSEEYCESICIYRSISGKLINYNAFLLHGACIEYHGNVYVFLAKSGIGKSTHIRLWKKVYGDEVHIINGDKPIIRKAKDGFYVYGTPWCGKEGWNINTSAPLKAFCFIERGADNIINKMPASTVMKRLANQIIMPKEMNEVIPYLDMMDNLIRETDCYLLQCNMEEEAAKVACKCICQC